MLTKLRVKNLKAWGEQLWDEGVELAPITLFLGPNSAGKTSLLQAPLLLKQTFMSPDPNTQLNLGGQRTDLVDWGTFESVVHGGDPNRELGIGVSLGTWESREERDYLGYKAIFTGSGIAASLQYLELKEYERAFIGKKEGRAYVYESTDGGSNQGQAPARSIGYPALLYGISEPRTVVYIHLPGEIYSQIVSLAYLGPLRDAPSRIYGWTGGRPGDLGSRGEQAMAALLASVEQGADGKGGYLVENVSRWLKKLGLADELRLTRHGSSRYHELLVLNEGRRTSIMDVGFGISQVLPMLVLAYFVREGTTIIAEQPEIHLHPRAQAGLAELMVEVAKERNVQFIVETHSEHLFRRLQTLMADEQIAADDCRLYFVDRDEEKKAQLTQLEVDQYGRVKNWPKQFFGDVIGETERQTRKMLERMARERGKK